MTDLMFRIVLCGAATKYVCVAITLNYCISLSQLALSLLIIYRLYYQSFNKTILTIDTSQNNELVSEN